MEITLPVKVCSRGDQVPPLLQELGAKTGAHQSAADLYTSSATWQGKYSCVPGNSSSALMPTVLWACRMRIQGLP